jgi:hypothetical protein
MAAGVRDKDNRLLADANVCGLQWPLTNINMYVGCVLCVCVLLPPTQLSRGPSSYRYEGVGDQAQGARQEGRGSIGQRCVQACVRRDVLPNPLTSFQGGMSTLRNRLGLDWLLILIWTR